MAENNNIPQEIVDLANKLLDLYKKQLKENDNIATGDLYNKTKVKCMWRGKWFIVGFSIPYYWKYVEYGTPPHFPPPDAIADWLVAKKLVPSPASLQEAKKVKRKAYAICRVINGEIKGKKGGTKAYHPMRDAVESKEGEAILEEIEETLIRLFEEELETEIEETL